MPIRWVDTDQGDDDHPEYRSRIVAKDLKVKRDPTMAAIDSFVPMPPLEMLKLLLSMAAMAWRRNSGCDGSGRPQSPLERGSATYHLHQTPGGGS